MSSGKPWENLLQTKIEMNEPGALGRVFAHLHALVASSDDPTVTADLKFTRYELNAKLRWRPGSSNFTALSNMLVDTGEAEKGEGRIRMDEGAWVAHVTSHHGNGLYMLSIVVERVVVAVEVHVKDGDKVGEGTVVATLKSEGGEVAAVRACGSGVVAEVNEILRGDKAGDVVTKDGMGKGWVCIIKGGGERKGKRKKEGKKGGVGGNNMKKQKHET